MYKLGLDDIGIYCHNTYFIAKSITVLLYTYHDIFLISFSAEGQLCNRVHYSSGYIYSYMYILYEKYFQTFYDSCSHCYIEHSI